MLFLPCGRGEVDQGGPAARFARQASAAGESGPILVPGKPEESPILEALRHEGLAMPPKGKLPDAAIADLRRRGLLEDTLIWWGSEFGRTPYAEKNGTGRDHNPGGFTIWLAGAGVKPGFAFGETDEFGHRAVQDKVHMHDLHALDLRLPRLDRHDGRPLHRRGDDRRGPLPGPACREGQPGHRHSGTTESLSQ